jgi:DNA polymerase sigma
VLLVNRLLHLFGHQTIWPGMCSVEMYGSCATELDLPSSDLDVVVCGLDRPVDTVPDIVPDMQSGSSDATQPMSSDASTESKKSEIPASEPAHSPNDSQHNQQHIQSERTPSHQSQMPLMYGHLSMNADRVVRLAMELEMQPWAVHVKAIPTASVPVIKILADPARLNGAVRTETGEWLVQQTASGQTITVDSSVSNLEAPSGNKTSMSGFHSSQSPPPWRGADVVNGLMKVDITFEGPEHGGIGSTKFSSRVVQEFCKETNLPADQTPAVQVLMVLKELLAQRRLNEPFSGGLSSYALLLLVISVVRERAIIKEELDRVERQRRIVAAGGGNSTLRVNHAEFVPHGKNQENQQAKPVGNSRKKKGDGSQVDEQATKSALVANQNTKKLPPGKPQVVDHSQAGRSKEPANNGAASENPGSTQQKATNSTKGSRQDSEKDEPAVAGKKPSGGAKSSSWASIAKKSTSGSLDRKSSQDSIQSSSPEKKAPQHTKPKVSSFADAVAKGTQTAANPASGAGKQTKKAGPDEKKNRLKKGESKHTNHQTPTGARAQGQPEAGAPSSAVITPTTANAGQAAPSPQKQIFTSYNQEAGASGLGQLFPQGFHDVTEVLCSGETTPGKLLMNFLLFYGQHFDSQSTAIDYSSTHQRDGNNNGYSHLSPYLQRRSAGSYDPMTGMLTVDPIVAYDPLEGAENNNVARSCFAWSSIRWVFAQSYMTLSSVVEMSASNTSAQGGAGNGNPLAPAKDTIGNAYAPAGAETWSGPYIHDDSGNVIVDPSSSLLELLLAF